MKYEIENDRDEGDEEQEREYFGDRPKNFKRKPDRKREQTDQRPHYEATIATICAKRDSCA